ncbi:hypothetical protein BIW11_04196 [Tropilaelaps mercedesae]|uniref:Uncharacterized protein n=1 Tax=Tropilaelaps mercedesae TaxID=418985 RepID=A0A1V9X9K9_9ACAR|nr:hypothetical protein BIW11_04196 [Tropilaelaps mercedesae]
MARGWRHTSATASCRRTAVYRPSCIYECVVLSCSTLTLSVVSVTRASQASADGPETVAARLGCFQLRSFAAVLSYWPAIGRRLTAASVKQALVTTPLLLLELVGLQHA